MVNACSGGVGGSRFRVSLVVALRISLFILLISLNACYKTVLPYTSTKHHHHAIYHVRAGDTLYNIGKRAGVSPRLLARRNHLSPPYIIYVGQRLYLRRTAPPVSYIPLPKTHVKKARVKHASRPKKKAHKTSGRKKHATHHRKKAHHRHIYTAKRGTVRLHWPVKGRISSPFGKRGRQMHDGIDIAVPDGTAVHAAAAGEVVYADHRLTGYGRLIIIRHTHDMFTAYAHNQRILVRKGDVVKSGAVIARSGHSGHATGPHLHFEVRRGPTPVNPIRYLPRRRK